MSFPCILHSQKGGKILVIDEDGKKDAYNAGFKDSPADFKEEPKKEEKAPVKKKVIKAKVKEIKDDNIPAE
jgi:hypothetical protein